MLKRQRNLITHANYGLPARAARFSFAHIFQRTRTNNKSCIQKQRDCARSAICFCESNLFPYPFHTEANPNPADSPNLITEGVSD